jgi:hypothetical protein
MGEAIRVRRKRSASRRGRPETAAAGLSIVPWAAGAGAIVTVLVVQLIATRSLVNGSREGRWVYPYVRAFSAELLLPFLAALALTLGMLYLTVRIFERHEGWTVVGWLAVGLLAQLALRWYAPASLEAIVVSDRANSFYSPTLRYGPLDFLTRYQAIVDTLPAHARTNMPGKVALYYLLELFTSSPAALGILVMGVSNLGGWLLYLAVRDLMQDKRTALFALVLYLFVPGKLFFFPILNTVSPVPILLCFFLHARFLSSRRWPWALGLGLALYLVMFFEPLPLVMGILFAAFLGAALLKGALPLRAAAMEVGLAAVGFTAVYALARTALHYDLFANLAYVLEDARAFNVRSRRPYGIWVGQNLYDFALAAGVWVAVLVPAALVVAVRGAGPLRERLARPAALWGFGTLAVLVLLDLAGINRGEVVRLWIFLACFLQAVPAYACARAPGLAPFAIVVAATLLEGAVGAGMVGYVLP